MDNNNNKSGGNFINGFLLGALVGAAVIFFLGTKKGKKILKAISEEGIDNISNLIDKVETAGDLDEFSDEEVEPVKEFAPKKEHAEKKRIVEDKPKVKRFFKGISKHVN